MWIRLALQELEKASTKEDALGIVDGAPDDLFNFYRRILSSAESEEEYAKVVSRILVFLSLAARPMTTEELCYAVRLDTN